MQVIFHLPNNLAVLVDIFAPVPAIGETVELRMAREWIGETVIDTARYTVADVAHYIDAFQLSSLDVKKRADAGQSVIHYTGARLAVSVYLKPKETA